MRTILRACMLGLGILSFNAAVFSQQQVAKTIPNSTSPDGLIGFLQFTPSDYGSQKHPLIIFLHGIGERGNGTSQIGVVANNGTPNYCAHGASMRFSVNGQTSSFVVLSPQLSAQYGYWPTYYVKEMIAYAKANLSIDPNRIYVTGLSLGGGGVWRLITDTQNFDHTFDGTIAAAAPVCGTQEETDADFCSTIGTNHLPVWAFHSMDDGTVSVGATQHAEILGNMCGNFSPAMKFTYYQSGGHGGAWINAYDTGHITVPVNVNGSVSNFTANPNLYEWFLSNTRGATAQPTYTAPVANAGVAQSITLPLNTITLAGSGAGTNGATIKSYSWTKTSGPSAGLISLPLLNTTIVTGLVQGAYVFTLTVTDNHGLTSSSSVTITVNSVLAFLPVINKAPSANAGSNSSITLPTNSITLDGSASSDPDGYIASYWWTQTGGPAGAVMTSRNAATTSVTSLVAATYTFVLQVTDNAGAIAFSNVTVTVNPAPVVTASPNNQAPYANAGVAQTVNLPTNSVVLNGSGSSDPDGYIASYWWTQTTGSGSPVMSSRNAASTNVTGLVAGTYNFVLQVTDNGGLVGFSNVTITVNAASATPPPPGQGQPIGYVKQTLGLWQACSDASSDGRTPIYCSSIANGNIVYLDAGLTQIYNGGFNWFSFTAVLGGPSTQGFSIFPDGVIHLLSACAVTTPVLPPVVTPAGNLLGYLKMSVGPYQACDDASSSGRMAIYGTNIANGSYLYTDAAMTQIFDGGWNWYSFTPVLGGPVTYAFAVYPIGSIGLLRNCTTGGSSRSIDGAAEISIVQQAEAAVATGKLSMYPNPVRSSATIQLSSIENGAKTINLYNTSGVLVAKYTWQTIKGNNTFSLKNISGLSAGLYIADIRDSSGKPVGKLKFVKQ
ncbi:MAG: T9SS type A sorting domain-containing protein [Bacteroidota bacterium]